MSARHLLTASATCRAKSHRQLLLRVKDLEGQLARMHGSLICAFNQILDLKDLHTGLHSTRLAEWGVRVARELGVGEAYLHHVEIAALLHDIGKIGVPDAILQKPGPLTEGEWAVMKKHPEYGWAIMRPFPDLARASLFVLHHHERFDGSGYPTRLKGDDIPLGARIVAVIDAFDAMSTNRPYQQGLTFDEAIGRLMFLADSHFDPLVVECFVRRAFEDRPAALAATSDGASIAL